MGNHGFLVKLEGGCCDYRATIFSGSKQDVKEGGGYVYHNDYMFYSKKDVIKKLRNEGISVSHKFY